MILRENTEEETLIMNLPDLHSHLVGTALHCDVLDVLEGYLHNCGKKFTVLDEDALLKLKCEWKTKCLKVESEYLLEKQYHLLYNVAAHKPVAVVILDKHWSTVNNDVMIIHAEMFNKLIQEDILKVGVVKCQSYENLLSDLLQELGE